MLRFLVRLPRNAKRLLMVSLDLAMLPAALWLGFVLRFGTLTPDVGRLWWLFPLVPFLTIPVFVRLGLYRAVIRFMGPQAVFAVLQGVTISAVVLGAVAMLVDRMGFPRSVLALYWLIALLCVGGSRFIVRAYLQQAERTALPREPVVIYGAGMAGAQLAAALQAGREFDPVAFVDDDSNLHGSTIQGIKVYRPARLAALVAEFGVSQVLLALPSVSRRRRRIILNQLETLPVHVKTIPALADLVGGAARLDEIREIDIADLLGRDPVAPDHRLLVRCVQDKSVLVTGAGGSIGSELCRQIVRLRPKRLVLFEISEFALYSTELELRHVIAQDNLDVELIPLLGSSLDRQRLGQVMDTFAIQTVYHTAAYKHVPIVEQNIAEGVRNNVFGTLNCAEAALQAGVETFVLISTDKAVRPTNVMGATKRFAELLLQGLATQGGSTAFCMVRFGNVLDSSGSVVPLFREQIRLGGPVTVTHQDVTRYFMTIPEAAALVIQAGSMARGGEIFVLDMGEPVRIVDLARKMIHLSGYKVLDEQHPDGDIEIQYTGLRPGEKIFEELLIGGNVTGTEHPMIMRAEEGDRPWGEIQQILRNLRTALAENNCERIIDLLREAVPEFVSREGLVDLLGTQAPATPPRQPPDDKVAWLKI